MPFKEICGSSHLALKSFDHMVLGHHRQCFEDLFGHRVSCPLTVPSQNMSGNLSLKTDPEYCIFLKDLLPVPVLSPQALL